MKQNRDEDRTQLVKCLPHNHEALETLSVDPRTHTQSWLQYIMSPYLCWGDTGDRVLGLPRQSG